MPDDLDYVWLEWLIEHVDEWTPADAVTVEALIANQKRAVDELHPRDARGRQRMQAVVEALEAALDEYHRRHTH